MNSKSAESSAISSTLPDSPQNPAGSLPGTPGAGAGADLASWLADLAGALGLSRVEALIRLADTLGPQEREAFINQVMQMLKPE